MTNAVRLAQKLGQSTWYDNIRRGLLVSGELSRLIEMGVTGVTSNPTIFEKAIAGSTDYDGALLDEDHDGKSEREIFEELVLADIRVAADLLLPTFEATGGRDGFVSLEVDPSLANDAEGTVAEGRRLFATLALPNVMIKVPATREGIAAAGRLIGEGINVNVTLIFGLAAYRAVVESYLSGLEELTAKGGDASAVASVASLFVSRVDTVVDKLLEERIRGGEGELASLTGRAAISNVKLAYQHFRLVFNGERFAALKEQGARVQRPLWASTGTKNPAYSDVLYVESLIGSDTVNTMPPATLTAFVEHGRAEATLETGIDEAKSTMARLARAGIDVEQVSDQLSRDGVAAFAASFDSILSNIAGKRAELAARGRASGWEALAALAPEVEEAMAALKEQDLVRRIWWKDHTVWKQEPTEITNRLGWLCITEQMCEHAPALEEFAREIREAGYRHVVLLGMGGSGLGPEVLRRSFGRVDGYPELLVLDSTVPEWIAETGRRIAPEKTLFLVSSKSGGTVETLSLYSHFRGLVEERKGREGAGENFVAITDPGTSLEALAKEQGFRRLFLNAPDIGGRYSVLSYFGLVPAALAGVDVTKLLDRADCMREGCAACVPAEDNPGALLGAAMGRLAMAGRDKLTIVASPGIASFGLWAEQLLAESTGKDGTGIVPVSEEPLLGPEGYGDDRAFVYLRLEGDENEALDAALGRLEAAGHPVIRLALIDRYDLGAEFFRWEFATVVAGSLLGIHPFDQPDVQGAKEATDRVLARYRESGKEPSSAGSGLLEELLSEARPGDYLAIMAYCNASEQLDSAVARLRAAVTERHRIATTFGYGPRYLHSTGQLHKGGPNKGLFLQLTAEFETDVPIPGALYSFGTLARAQAQGDLETLVALGRRVARVSLGRAPEAAVERLAEGLG